jgi:hypothetical protein
MLAICTPVLKNYFQRLRLDITEEDADQLYCHWPRRAGAVYGEVTDRNSGARSRIYGKPCGLRGCDCDAWAVEIDPKTGKLQPASKAQSRPGLQRVGDSHTPFAMVLGDLFDDAKGRET